MSTGLPDTGRMSGKHAGPMLSPLVPPSVVGLEHGRQAARRRAARQRFKNTVVSGTLFVVFAGVVGGAGWFGYQFFTEERDKISYDEQPAPQRSTDEVIDILEEQPRWNGPGNPTFGVGND